MKTPSPLMGADKGRYTHKFFKTCLWERRLRRDNWQGQRHDRS
jgi:hypothetical protein